MFNLHWGVVCILLCAVIHVHPQVLRASLAGGLEGRVVLELYNRTGVVCHDMFTTRDAAVVCSTIPGAVRSGVVRSAPVNGTWVWLRRLGCRGTERTVQDCTLIGWQPGFCRSGLAAAVQCRTLAQGLPSTSSPRPPPSTTTSSYFSVSLENTSDSGTSGRVVVRWHSDRGVICGDGFDDQDAQVVCRMLGLKTEEAVVKYYPRGDRDFFMAELNCTGDEPTLLHCHIGRWAPINCSRPLQDVGVSCGQEKPAAPSVPCGTRFTKIFGGSLALPGSWPWIASLQNLQEIDNITFCGAAVVAPQWLLTAAHCASPIVHRQSSITAVMGTNDLNRGGVRLGLSRIIIHPDFLEDNLQNDVALLKLRQPLNYSRTIRPICLNTDSGTPFSECYAAGWGITGLGTEPTTRLRSALLPIAPHSGCEYVPIYNSSIMLCAGLPRGSRDVCLGDSGGPLMCRRPGSSVYDLWGLVTGGEPCGTFFSTYSVYTDVSKQLTWINTIIKS